MNRNRDTGFVRRGGAAGGRPLRFRGTRGPTGPGFRRTAVLGFTLIEIVLVMIILGVLSVLAMVRYQNTVREAREQYLITQLQAIHTANRVYFQRSNTTPQGYLPGMSLALDAINAGLGLSIFANDIVFTYTRTSPTIYSARGTVPEGFTLRVSDDADNPIDLGSNNPCCSSGTCPTVPNCT